MSINAIFACKLYKASNNKNKIRAAVNNPINAELVTQLAEYLDDEYVEKAAKPSAPDDVEDKKEEKIRPSESAGNNRGGGVGGTPSSGMDTHLSDKLAEAEKDDFTFDDAVDNTPAPKEESTSDSDVAESTKVASTKITASMNYVSEIEAIKGLLNSTEDTAGVCRIVIKEGELWIHYNDSINLNNVMEPVIALLNASVYGSLDFNRLARTENAIVFSISVVPEPVESIQEIEDEKK